MRPNHPKKRFAKTAAFFLWVPAWASACPLCDSETGKQVRAGIFGDDFWSTLLVVVSPFPVLLLALAAYQYDWLRFGQSKATKDQSEPTPVKP